MPTITKKKKQAKKPTHLYKVGERLDMSVAFELPNLDDLHELNESLYKKDITEKDWKLEVTKRLAKKGLNYGEFDAIISNSGLDRQGEQILVEGIDLSHMKLNAPMPWSHEYANLPLGKWLKLWKSGGNLMGRGRMDYDIYDFADLAYKMLLRGTLNAISIGGLIRELDDEDYNVIKKLEMVEASVVMVGAHPDALIVSRSLGLSEKEFKGKYEQYLHKALLDKMKEMPDSEIKDAVKVLKSLTARLEDTLTAETLTGAKTIKRKVVLQSAKDLNTQTQKIIKIVKLK